MVLFCFVLDLHISARKMLKLF